MTDAQRQEKIRSAVAQAAALSEARKDVKRLHYGQKEHSADRQRYQTMSLSRPRNRKRHRRSFSPAVE